MRMMFQDRLFPNRAAAITTSLIGLVPVLAIASPAAAQDRLVADDRVVALSSAYEAVRDLPDYGTFVSVHCDPQNHIYDFVYATKDGAERLVAISDLTGREIEAAGCFENRQSLLHRPEASASSGTSGAGRV